MKPQRKESMNNVWRNKTEKQKAKEGLAQPDFVRAPEPFRRGHNPTAK